MEIEQLRSLGYKIYISEPESLLSIAETINKFGILADSELQAKKSSDEFIRRLKELTSQYSGRTKVSTFYQFWNQPIFTINGGHLISEIIELCGGKNIFADLSILSSQVGLESVLANKPDVIIASGIAAERPEWLDEWEKWPSINAVKNQQLYFIPPDVIQRHTSRVLQGAAMMCDYIDAARMALR
jgi:iron complex transport system substrate-binding protein